jgi:hypothetical protein
MHDPNRQLLEQAVHLLRPLLDDLVFVGGCATGLLITDPDAVGIRATRDVDAITQISSYAEYAALSERLRGVGLKEDTEEGVICRWRYEGLIIDVMPTDEQILGFSNRWYVAAIASALHVDLDEDEIQLIAPEYFLATKLEAFHGRGQGDYAGSHDLEDAIALIDGRAEIILEVRDAEADVRQYLSETFRALLETRAFNDALPGFLLPDAANQERLPRLLARLKGIAESAASR